MATTNKTLTTSPPANLVFFARGVISRLSFWPALRLAVEQGWGGPESAAKRTWMASVIVDAFEDEKPSVSAHEPNSHQIPDPQYVEELLLQIMEDEFDTVLEDGSAQAVAKDVCRLWSDVQGEGGATAVEKLEAEAEKAGKKKVQVQEELASDDEGDWSTDGEDGDETMDVEGGEEAPPLLDRSRREPILDEDGFTLVQSKGKERK